MKQSKVFWNERLKRISSLIKKNMWYTFLLSISTVYVFYYRNEIYQLKELNARNLIFLIWLIVLLLPLFSEMELLGVKIKRAIDKANKEIKDNVSDIEKQIVELKLTNNVANNIQIGNSSLPTEEKLEELLQLLRNMKPVTEKTAKEDVPQDKAVYLFKVRLEIEKVLNEMADRAGMKRNHPGTLFYITKWLVGNEIIDVVTSDLIFEVVRIANRGVHGEIISDEYISFVQKAHPEIMMNLKSDLQKM